jgi:hypothetical protein
LDNNGNVSLSKTEPTDKTKLYQKIENVNKMDIPFYNLNPKNLMSVASWIIKLDKDGKEYSVQETGNGDTAEITFDYLTNNKLSGVVNLVGGSFTIKNLAVVIYKDNNISYVVRTLPKDKNQFKTFGIDEDLLTLNYKFQDIIYSINKLDNTFVTDLDIYYQQLGVHTINKMDRIGHEQEYDEPKYIKYLFSHIDNYNKCIFNTD